MKHPVIIRIECPVPLFPSSAEDGSIEAPHGAAIIIACCTVFPSSAEDGSIEAVLKGYKTRQRSTLVSVLS